jgi:hypothetical protein
MTVDLTEPLQVALDASGEEPLRLIDPRTNESYVLVKAETYERLKALLYDDGPPSEEEMRRQLAASGERAGWTDPEMDVYDNYDESRRRQWP